MKRTNEELKSRITNRIKWGLGMLILLSLFASHLFLTQKWKMAEELAEFYARVDLNLITDEKRTATERLNAIHLMANAAEDHPLGLIADALFQFSDFENRLLREQQLITPHDSIPGMVFIPAGNFLFGGVGTYHGTPADTFLVEFYIDQYPVTNKEFCRFLNDSGNRIEGGALWYKAKTGHIQENPGGFVVQAGFEDHPVVSVTWFGARAFAAANSKRLPTEHEWEKAARGIYGRLYPWGNTFESKRCNSASFWSGTDITSANRDNWYNSGGRRLVDTTPVAEFPAGVSPYGCFDMCGNVWEWTVSKHEVIKDNQISYVNRGGAFSYGRDQIQNPHRGRGLPNVCGSITGFRCVKDFQADSLW